MEIRNPKSESRNPKQYRNQKKECQKRPGTSFGFACLELGFVSDFVFRISCFGGVMLSSTALKMAVACRNLVKEFGDGDQKVMALRGVNVDVPPGEMTLLVGPSGCGKTTLISILAGLLDPTSGALQVLGADLMKMSDRKKVNFRAKNIG